MYIIYKRQFFYEDTRYTKGFDVSDYLFTMSFMNENNFCKKSAILANSNHSIAEIMACDTQKL